MTPSDNGEEAHRHVWRVVGVRVGLPRHDMEVEGVVVKDETPRPLLHMQSFCRDHEFSLFRVDGSDGKALKTSFRESLMQIEYT